MKKQFILGYPCGADVDEKNLVEYADVNTASFETDEWCFVKANTLEEAKQNYEFTFDQLKKEGKISGPL